MTAWSVLRRRPSRGTVAFNMKPVAGPWGGSSPFVEQLARLLREHDFHVCYDLERPVDVIVLVDPREAANKPFGPAEIARYRQAQPGVRVLHRVNECDQRKGTDFMDALLKDANTVADHTVFISAWLRDYHAARWFVPTRSHSVIYNGADDRVFFPAPRPAGGATDLFRVVTHHWSDNELKGFDAYAQVDRALAGGALPGFELWVIGRWPASLTWARARTFAPARGRALADLLRECHAYVTASRWEPCGMHHVEGAQCGLPLAYHRDGGGIVEAGLQYGVPFEADPVPALHALRDRYHELRQAVLARRPSGLAMCSSYLRVIESLMDQST